MYKKLAAAVLCCCLAAALLFTASSVSNVSKAAGDSPETPSPAPAMEPEEPAEESPAQEPEEPEEPEEEPAPVLTLEAIRLVSFQDLPTDSSQADCIRYAAYQGLLSGVTEDRFDPDGLASLASVVTVLHRMSGDGAPAYTGAFPDVPEGKWYTDAVSWAAQAGIVTGRSDGTLRPLEPVTRTQLAALLYRCAAGGSQPYDEQLANYTDGASVPDYARGPMAWALENRLFSGMIANTIHPKLPVTRAQLAQALVALTAYGSEEPVAAALTTQMSAKIAVSASQDKHEDIQLLVDQAASKYGAVGLQVAVVEDGHVTDAYTCGYAAKGQTPMTAEHKIRAASISKVAVGMAAMLLREQGYIGLDQDISAYWGVKIQNPTYPNIPITIRSLLTHTSSIRVLDSASRLYGPVKAQLSSPSGFTAKMPGAISSWSYNNYGYAVLGMTLELASGQYLDAVMDSGMWDIMEIDAAFEGGRVDRKDLIATLYQDGAVSRTAAAQASYLPKDTPGGTGAFFQGGLTISARDLAKMAALLASDGYYEGLRLMQPESVELLETRDDTLLPDGTYQAVALRSQDNLYGRDRLYYHTGSAYGVYNLFSYDPAERDGVVVLTVGASGVKDDRNIYAVCSEISQYIYEAIA